jgi:hypothetical protein
MQFSEMDGIILAHGDQFLAGIAAMFIKNIFYGWLNEKLQA